MSPSPLLCEDNAHKCLADIEVERLPNDLESGELRGHQGIFSWEGQKLHYFITIIKEMRVSPDKIWLPDIVPI
jgi:hypothetical protein